MEPERISDWPASSPFTPAKMLMAFVANTACAVHNVCIYFSTCSLVQCVSVRRYSTTTWNSPSVGCGSVMMVCVVGTRTCKQEHIYVVEIPKRHRRHPEHFPGAVDKRHNHTHIHGPMSSSSSSSSHHHQHHHQQSSSSSSSSSASSSSSSSSESSSSSSSE